MKTEIFYFSGTGNSLLLARDIIRKTTGTLIPIKSTQQLQIVQSDAQMIGLVFPAYYMRIPRIVERFIDRLVFQESTYIFAVVTVAGIAGKVFDRLAAALQRRGGTLASGFLVRMPPNYIHDADAFPPFMQKRLFKKWERKLDAIYGEITSGKRGKMETVHPIGTFLFSRYVEKQYQSGALRPDIDQHFWVDENCSHCGICQRICPVSNIRMDDGTPSWNGACEKCLASIQWCPEQAIQFGKVTANRKRYHHPDIKLSDMLNAKVERYA